MTVSEFLSQRNTKILERYNELRSQKITAPQAKKIISSEFNNLSIHTIEQVIYNKSYSNSPHKK